MLIGPGTGLMLSLAVINEVFKSLIGGARIDRYSIDKVLIVTPSLLLIAGAFLLLWKPRKKPGTNPLTVDSSHGREMP